MQNDDLVTHWQKIREIDSDTPIVIVDVRDCNTIKVISFLGFFFFFSISIFFSFLEAL